MLSTRPTLLLLLPSLLVGSSPLLAEHRTSRLVPVEWQHSTEEPSPEAKRHTVYQNPQNQGLVDGFRRATEPLVRAGQDLSQASGQTLRDLGTGTRDATQNAFNGVRDTLQSGGRALGQSVENTLNVGNQQYFEERQRENQLQHPTTQDRNLIPAGGQPYAATQSNPQWSTAAPPAGPQLPNQNYNNQPSEPTRNLDTGIATTFGQQGAGAARSPQPSYADRAPLTNQPLYSGSNNYPPVNNNYRNDSTSRVVPVQNRGLLDPPQPSDFGYTSSARSPATGSPPWQPTNATPPNNANPASWGTPQYPAQQPAQASTFPVSQPPRAVPPSTGRSLDGDVRSWGDPNAQTISGSTTQQATGVGSLDPPSMANNQLLPLVLLCLSLAANFYVWTTYLDVRNRYRAALRRQPTSMMAA